MLHPMDPPPRHQIAERLWAGKTQTLHILEELRAEGRCDFTVYLGPDSSGPDAAILATVPGGPTMTEVAEVAGQVGRTPGWCCAGTPTGSWPWYRRSP